MNFFLKQTLINTIIATCLMGHAHSASFYNRFILLKNENDLQVDIPSQPLTAGVAETPSTQEYLYNLEYYSKIKIETEESLNNSLINLNKVMSISENNKNRKKHTDILNRLQNYFSYASEVVYFTTLRNNLNDYFLQFSKESPINSDIFEFIIQISKNKADIKKTENEIKLIEKEIKFLNSNPSQTDIDKIIKYSKQDNKKFGNIIKTRKAECEAKEQEYNQILRDYLNPKIQ